MVVIGIVVIVTVVIVIVVVLTVANHAKYFHVTSDLGVECPKCESEFVATKIFSHLIESHIV